MINTGDQALITQVLESYNTLNTNLAQQLYDILYYFRGALSRDDVWAMSPFEREQAVVFLNKRVAEASEIAKKTGQMPFI